MSEPETTALLVRLAGPRPEVPPEREARAREAVHAAWRRSLRERRRRRRLALAAGFVAAGTAAGVAVLVRPDATAPPTVTAAPFARVERADPGTGWRIGERVRFGAWIRTGGGGLALRGPRDVSLRLAPGSRLLPIGPERVRLEDGALYVDSRAASLAVETPHGTVTDVGTQFEARLAGAALAVRVRDGRVRVVADDRTWEAAAGEEVELAGGAVARRRIAPDDEAWAWVEALAQPPAIEGRPLLAFLEWVARERGLRLAFANGDAARRAAKLRLHGDLSGLSVGEALEAVMATTGFSARVRAGALVVDGPPRR